MRGNIAQYLALRRWQHQVVPRHRRLDPLRQIVQARSRLHPAGIPHRSRKIVTGIAVQPTERIGAGSANGVGAEIELRYQHIHLTVKMPGCGAERRVPGVTLLIASRAMHIDGDSHPLRRAPAVARRDDQRAAGPFEQPGQHTGARRFCGINIITLNQQCAGAERRFPLPQPNQRLDIGKRRRQQRCVQHIQFQPDRCACRRRDRLTGHTFIAADLDERQ